jgi:antitoxin FitA
MLDQDYRRHVPPHLRAAMERLPDPQAVWDIYRDDDTVADMERLSALKRPALGAASAKLLALGAWVRGKDARKTFGKLARCIMEKDGYVIDMGGVETPKDPLFRKGTRYRRREPASSNATPGILNIRGMDPEVSAKLLVRAARNGRSLEAEALQILSEAVAADILKAKPHLAEAIHRRFAALGGVDDLPPHPPVSTEPPTEFDP